MSAGPTYKGFDREHDLPMLGVDMSKPLAVRPPESPDMRDNRDPVEDIESIMLDVDLDRINASRDAADRHDNHGPAFPASDGRKLMAYHRELATAQVNPVAVVSGRPLAAHEIEVEFSQ